jgi:hypothetical protein
MGSLVGKKMVNLGRMGFKNVSSDRSPCVPRVPSLSPFVKFVGFVVGFLSASALSFSHPPLATVSESPRIRVENA